MTEASWLRVLKCCACKSVHVRCLIRSVEPFAYWQACKCNQHWQWCSSYAPPYPLPQSSWCIQHPKVRLVADTTYKKQINPEILNMYLQFWYVLTALAGALSKPAPQVDPACIQLHSLILAGILVSWKESILSMAQPQVPKTCSFEKTLEMLADASKKISAFPTHIFNESALKGFLTGLYILICDLPR